MKILTKLGNGGNTGWIAYLENREGLWEWGESEAEAIGKLFISLRESWNDEMDVQIVYK